MTRKGLNSLKLHFFILQSLFPLDWKSEKERSVPGSWMCHGATSRWDSLPKDSVWRFSIPEYSQVLSKPMRKLSPGNGEILWVLGTIKSFRIYPISENLVNVNKHTYSSLVLYLSYSHGKISSSPKATWDWCVAASALSGNLWFAKSWASDLSSWLGFDRKTEAPKSPRTTTTSSTTTSNSNQQQPTALRAASSGGST